MPELALEGLERCNIWMPPEPLFQDLGKRGRYRVVHHTWNDRDPSCAPFFHLLLQSKQKTANAVNSARRTLGFRRRRRVGVYGAEKCSLKSVTSIYGRCVNSDFLNEEEAEFSDDQSPRDSFVTCRISEQSQSSDSSFLDCDSLSEYSSDTVPATESSNRCCARLPRCEGEIAIGFGIKLFCNSRRQRAMIYIHIP